MKNKKNWTGIILNAVIIVLGVIIAYMLILKILGKSPTDFVILYSFIGILVINGFRTENRLGKLEEFANVTKHSFKTIREDVKDFRKNIQDLREDVLDIKKDMHSIKRAVRAK